MKTRFIPFDSYNPYVKNGLNEAAMTTVKRTGTSIVWFSGWDEPTVNIGRNQVAENVCDLDAMSDDNVTLVRRQGGGGAVYLAPGNEISWSMVTPSSRRPDTVQCVHQDVCEKIVEALHEIGIESWHEPVNDVVTSEGKISGGSLRRKTGVVYTGCTLLYDVDPDKMFTYLSNSDRPRGGVDSIANHANIGFDQAVRAVQKSIISHYDAERSQWSDEERRRAERHADKYSQSSWLHRD